MHVVRLERMHLEISSSACKRPHRLPRSRSRRLVCTSRGRTAPADASAPAGCPHVLAPTSASFCAAANVTRDNMRLWNGWRDWMRKRGSREIREVWLKRSRKREKENFKLNTLYCTYNTMHWIRTLWVLAFALERLSSSGIGKSSRRHSRKKI